MYSEADIDAAIAAGAISEDAARALRTHVAALRHTPGADEESFRLLTGFNDIFVSIASVLLLVALAWIGASFHKALGGAFVAAAAWPLAEYFTRTRRMALPSIILLLAFVGGIGGTFIGLLVEHADAWLGKNPAPALVGFISVGIGAAMVTGAWLHWRRFMVPITVAAGAAALAGTAIAAVLAVLRTTGMESPGENIVMALIMTAGITIFLAAMWWDRSDRERQTRRSDVAFWLHLLAAPMIAHSLFALLGVSDGQAIGLPVVGLVIALYLLFGLVALAIDRRALLVSALAYVLFAMTQLFEQFGAVELNVALTGLVIGSALLLLSAFWQHARRLVVATLPDAVRTMVPAPAQIANPA